MEMVPYAACSVVVSCPGHTLIAPGDRDVRFGKQGQRDRHDGTIRFKQLITQFVIPYHSASNADKNSFVQLILKQMASEGRQFFVLVPFDEQVNVPNTFVWEPLTDPATLQGKVKERLRDKYKVTYISPRKIHSNRNHHPVQVVHSLATNNDLQLSLMNNIDPQMGNSIRVPKGDNPPLQAMGYFCPDQVTPIVPGEDPVYAAPNNVQLPEGENFPADSPIVNSSALDSTQTTLLDIIDTISDIEEDTLSDIEDWFSPALFE
jgi:hypothetical protein